MVTVALPPPGFASVLLSKRAYTMVRSPMKMGGTTVGATLAQYPGGRSKVTRVPVTAGCMACFRERITYKVCVCGGGGERGYATWTLIYDVCIELKI